MKDIYEWIDEHCQEALADLFTLCRQPSISAQGIGIDETVELVESLLKRVGAKVRVFSTASHPVVYAEIPGEAPFTLLLYNHYDVQPPEPLEQWIVPPFEPQIKEGKIIGRGVADDKGDIISRLLAIRSFLEVRGNLPISVKFLIEGGEEIGSPGLSEFVSDKKDLLKADACIWEAGKVSSDGRPIICLGVKGMLYVELEARGAGCWSTPSRSPGPPRRCCRCTRSSTPTCC